MQFSLRQWMFIMVVVGCENHRQKNHFMHIVVSFKLIKLRLKNNHWIALIELILKRYDVIVTCRRVNLPKISKLFAIIYRWKNSFQNSRRLSNIFFGHRMHIVWKEECTLTLSMTLQSNCHLCWFNFLGIKINQKSENLNFFFLCFYHAACKTHWDMWKERDRNTGIDEEWWHKTNILKFY